MIEAEDYMRRCLTELESTHNRVSLHFQKPIWETRNGVIHATKPYLKLLPKWVARWCEESYDKHPVTGKAYKCPNFRCTIKIHKTPAQTRPITVNHCWATQPPAQLLAKLLLPYVCDLPVYVRDTDDINRLLLDPIRGDFLLLTCDIVRLYPPIPHRRCFSLL